MKKIHAEIKIRGIVQGVGFRPFVHKKAEELSLCGFVRNTSYGADVSFEGEESSIDLFMLSLKKEAPSLAFIEKAECEKSYELSGYN